MILRYRFLHLIKQSHLLNSNLMTEVSLYFLFWIFAPRERYYGFTLVCLVVCLYVPLFVSLQLFSVTTHCIFLILCMMLNVSNCQKLVELDFSMNFFFFFFFFDDHSWAKGAKKWLIRGFTLFLTKII